MAGNRAKEKQPRKQSGSVEVFRFHDNHGSNIVLGDNQRTAVTEGDDDDDDHRVVVSRDPMQVNKLYEIRVDRRTRRPKGCLPVGVVLSSPDTLTLPDGVYGWEDAVVVYSNVVSHHGRWHDCDVGEELWSVKTGHRAGVSNDTTISTTSPSPPPPPPHCMISLLQHDCDVGEELWSVKTGHRVGVSIDSHRLLHVHINGRDQGVISVAGSLPDPCYPMFHVRGRYRQVTPLPVTSVR